MSTPDAQDAARAVRATRDWLERAVVGLNLCPFAKAVHVKGQVHYAVSRASTDEGVLQDFDDELAALCACTPEQRDTTLVILLHAFPDFLDFNTFLGRCRRRLRRAGLEGEIQLAEFHPDYVFADREPHDMANYTNRAPYPTLHLLREQSIERALASFPAPDSIYENNIRKLEQLGLEGWNNLGVGRP